MEADPQAHERVGDLEIPQDIRFEKRDWTFQRIGWIGMLLVALAALAGLLGPGPLTRMTAGQKDSALWVEYYRFERVEAPTDLKINIGPGAASGSELRLWIDRGYVENAEIEELSPEPNRYEAGPDRMIYIYGLADPSKATAIRVRFRGQQPGSREGKLGIEGGPEVSFGQFFYP